MTRSDAGAFVWAWLPGATAPVVCGRIEARGAYHDFTYGQSYLRRSDAFALDHLELPLTTGVQRSRRLIHGVIRDAAPDAWGRRVLQHRLGAGEGDLGELDYLVHGSTLRAGALHFQVSADEYAPVTPRTATLAELMHAATLVEQGSPLPQELSVALEHGTSIGGARPKATVVGDDGRHLLAKFSSTTDTWPVVRHEALGMALARDAGIDVVDARLTSVEGRDVLLVERFDIATVVGGSTRRHFFSALTALGLDELAARDAEYAELASFLGKYSDDPEADCRELYRRMVFNMVIGNTDDHARNHAVFWDGDRCRLTPAYDLCVYRRVGQEATQAMQVGAFGAASTLANAASVCERFLLASRDAEAIHDEICGQVEAQWRARAEALGLGAAQIEQLHGTAILSPYLFRAL